MALFVFIVFIVLQRLLISWDVQSWFWAKYVMLCLPTWVVLTWWPSGMSKCACWSAAYGEGFKRTWSEAKKEVWSLLRWIFWSLKVIFFSNQQAGWAEDGQGNGKCAGVSCAQQLNLHDSSCAVILGFNYVGIIVLDIVWHLRWFRSWWQWLKEVDSRSGILPRWY